MVMAYVFDEKVISPVGFLMSKEHHAEACPALNAYKYVDLPLDFPYRRIMVRAFLKAYPPEHSIAHVKIDEDNERRIPWSINVEDYIELSMARWQQVNEPFHVCLYDPETVMDYYFTASSYFNMVGGITTDNTRIVEAIMSRTGGFVQLRAPNTTTMLAQTMGYCPNHCFDFECGDPNDLNDWYDVTKVGSLKLNIKGHASRTAGNLQICLQQLRTY